MNPPSAIRVGICVAALAALMLTWSAPRAMATDLKGSIAARGVRTPQSAKVANYWNETNGALPPRKNALAASGSYCVVIRGKGKTTSPKYRFEGGTLMPSTIVLRAGSKASIINSDIFAHELYAPKLKELAPHTTPPGHVRKLMLGKTGVYELKDNQHPHVSAHLHVIKDLLRYVPVSRNGSFRFSMDPGSYKLEVYRGDKRVASRDITVAGKRGDLGRIKLAAPRK